MGVSTVPKLFNRQVIEAMAAINGQPIIFPHSNQTSRSEFATELPAKGMAVDATEATQVTDEMLIVAAKAVAEQVTDKALATRLGCSPQSQIPNASLLVADRGATHIFNNALMDVPRPDGVGAYKPVYPE